ncbi:MAG: hypothetical protein M5U21_05415 [Fimbriimonadaceae bacterium]|nr:hypothetical protein [Fimbriimonadaceae bacterium]
MRSQLTTQVELNSSNVPIVTLIDSYDAVGNRMTRSVNGTVATWSYDDLYRLTGQVKPGQVATYTLDGVGNLKTMWEGGSFPKTFTHDPADRLVTMIEGVKVTTYSYTGYGALEIEQTPTGFATHTYSGQDQLVGSVSGSGLTVSRSTYTFGGDGLRRTAQNGNVQPTTMVWDGADYLLLNGPSENQVVLTLGSEIVSCGDFDLLPDSLGSVIGDTRAGFDPRLLYEYWPYGMMSASVIRAMLPFLYVGSLGYYNDSADRDYVRARELMKKNGRWMQTDPLWPAEAPYRYVGCSPLAHIDPSGLKCQAPNPCSDLKGAQGACIALLCSFKTVDDMIKYLKKAINIDPKDFQGIEKLVRSLWGKKFSPEECCKKATGAPGFGSMEWLIKLLCTNSWFWGEEPAWSACAKKHPGGVGFGGDEEENAKCHACCFQQFPEDGPFDRLRGLCQKACDGVGLP